MKELFGLALAVALPFIVMMSIASAGAEQEAIAESLRIIATM